LLRETAVGWHQYKGRNDAKLPERRFSFDERKEFFQVSIKINQAEHGDLRRKGPLIDLNKGRGANDEPGNKQGSGKLRQAKTGVFQRHVL
jgi:hypothetical protein